MCRVSGNHDNMGCFLVAMETCELVLRLAPEQSWLGYSTWGWKLILQGPSITRDGEPPALMAKPPVSHG